MAKTRAERRALARLAKRKVKKLFRRVFKREDWLNERSLGKEASVHCTGNLSFHASGRWLRKVEGDADRAINPAEVRADLDTLEQFQEFLGDGDQDDVSA